MKTFAMLALAVGFCRPTLPKAEISAYAAIVESRSRAIGVDPLLIVALVDHESGWIPTVVNKKSGAVGLGQVLPRFRPACVGAPDSANCAAEHGRLLDGRYNLGATFDAIEAWQKACVATTGSATEAEWLFAYAGLNQPKLKIVCGRRWENGKWLALPVPALVNSYFKRQRALRLRIEDS